MSDLFRTETTFITRKKKTTFISIGLLDGVRSSSSCTAAVFFFFFLKEGKQQGSGKICRSGTKTQRAYVEAEMGLRIERAGNAKSGSERRAGLQLWACNFNYKVANPWGVPNGKHQPIGLARSRRLFHFPC
jgi:hypothetical protein